MSMQVYNYLPNNNYKNKIFFKLLRYDAIVFFDPHTSADALPPPPSHYLQGVPKVSLDFVFVIFSGSGAHTEKLVTFVQQPWKFATL